MIDARPFDVERLPPQDIKAEMSMLGACLRDRHAAEAMLGTAREEHFYRPFHQAVWKSIVALSSRGEPVDTVTVANEVMRHSSVTTVEAYDMVNECYDCTPTAANVEHYMAIVYEAWVRRELVGIASQMEAGARDTACNLQAMISDATQRALQLQIGREDTRALRHIRHIAEDLEADLAKGPLRANRGTSTGFAALDSLMRGYWPSDLHYWGGGPGSGKTTLSMQSAVRVAAKSPDSLVAYFSMEIGQQQFAKRLATFASGVSGKILEGGPASKLMLEMPQIQRGLARVKGLPLHVAFGRFSTTQIQARCKELMAAENRKLSVVFVDRIELLSDADCAAHEETKRIPILSPRVKGIATALDVTVVCLVQLNRAGRTGEPTMEAFRGSGAIEQDCQVGAIIRTDKDAMLASISVVKNNDGSTGACPQMRFDPNLPMFIEYDRRHEQ